MCVYVYVYVYVFGRVFLNPYQFSTAMKCSSTKHYTCSGEGSALKDGAGNQWLRPRDWELRKAELTLSLFHHQTMDSGPLLHWF